MSLKTPTPHQDKNLNITKEDPAKTRTLNSFKNKFHSSAQKLLLGLLGLGVISGFGFYRWLGISSAQQVYVAPKVIDNTEALAKRQTMQLVGLTLRLQKDPGSTSLIQQIQDLASSREKTMLSLISENPGLAVQIHFPANLLANLPIEAQNNIEHEVTLQGRLGVIDSHKIDPKTHDLTSYRFNYQLTEASGNHINLHFKDEGPSDSGGNTIKVKGVQLGNFMAIQNANGDVSNVANPSTVTTATLSPATNKKVAVVLINFLDDYSQPWTPDEVKAAVFGNSAPSTDTYYQEQSFEKTGIAGSQSVDGDVFGWYTINSYSNSCDYTTLANQANTILASNNIDTNSYDNFVYAFPHTSACGFDGAGDMPGNRVWINGFATDTGIISHELGHNYGADHASSYSCVDSTGARVVLSDSCTRSEYGDDFDVMGDASAENHMSTYHKGELGYFSAGNTQDVTTTGSYTVSPLESASAGVQSLRIPFKSSPGLTQPDSYYYIEYRQPIGYDSAGSLALNLNNTHGVMVRIASDYGTRSKSRLLDGSPSTDWTDVALTAGNSFTDVTQGITVTTTVVSASGATVQVDINPPPCVHAAPSITINPSAQWGYAGNTLSYTAVVKNNDSSNCSASNFTITGNLPQGLSQPFNPLKTTLLPGQTTNYTFSVVSSNTIAAGYYTFTETAADPAYPTYTTTASANYNVYPPADTTAPSAALSSPANNSIVSGTINVTGSATDNVGVTSSELYIDGTLRATSTSGNLTFSWNTINEYDGSHTLTYKAYDAAGNTGTASIAVKVANTADTLAPAVIISSPASGSKIGTKVSIIATANDNIGVTKMEIYIDGALNSTSNSGSISYSWNSAKVSKGTHTITAKAYDAAGNIGFASVNVSK